MKIQKELFIIEYGRYFKLVDLARIDSLSVTNDLRYLGNFFDFFNNNLFMCFVIEETKDCYCVFVQN